jgi:hypothetical protein
MACNDQTVERALRSPSRAAAEVVDAISFTAGNIFSNVTGDAITPGTYLIRPLDAPAKGLARSTSQENGDRVNLQTARTSNTQRWEVTIVPGQGYTIKSGGKFLDVAGETLLVDGGQVVIWDPNLPLDNHGPNQVWHFYNLGRNRYLLRNVASGKVLEGSDPVTSNEGRQWSGRDNARRQVWVIQRAP